MDLDKLIGLYPRVYHMAERGAWDSIRTHGLMSATAVLDHLSIEGCDRAQFESEHRSQKMDVRAGYPSNIVLRDQKPMPEDRLLKAITDGTTPQQWYELINNKVFFWAEESRLHRLLGARDYHRLEHDVLTLDSSSFIPAYAEAIWLCHMNSGNTWPMPHRRGTDIFCRIPDYPVKRSGNPTKPVVELVVDYAVTNIVDFVVEVRRMRGSEVLGIIG